jgi:ribosomal-protein-alanine N-acetyltransferase
MNLDWLPPTLETPRLILRPLDASDVDAVFAYASNPNMTRFTLWDAHRDRGDSMAFIDYARSRYAEQIPEPMGIVLRDRQDLGVIGSLGCFWAARAHNTMELGYAIGEPFWGRGLIPEAVRPLIAYAFTHYPVERMQARCFADNRASARVLEKLGWAYEGTLRSSLSRYGKHWDIRMYSLLKREWEWSGVKAESRK